jgi:competence protein ComEA
MKLPALREALTRQASRLAGSRFAKPVGRVVGVAAGLLLLAFIGRSAAGSMGSAASPLPSSAATASASVLSVAGIVPPLASPIASAPPTALVPAPAESSLPSAASPRSQASADDPVTLNTASFEDLRRLPGIGDKRANAILALRAHLGRFRAVEDLLKVKGIGRAMLKRLRPLVRLDPASAPDAGHGGHP